MTSELRDKVKSELFEIMSHYAEDFCFKVNGVQSFQATDVNDYIRQILSIPELAIVDRKAKMPSPYILTDSLGNLNDDFGLGTLRQKQILSQAGWVKEVKDGA